MEDPEQIPAHYSPVRFLSAKGTNTSYRAFKSLEEARGHGDTAAIMEGDYGGQIYFTCPVSRIACDEAHLLALFKCNRPGPTWRIMTGPARTVGRPVEVRQITDTTYIRETKSYSSSSAGGATGLSICGRNGGVDRSMFDAFCPLCGKPLASIRARQCIECGAHWFDGNPKNASR